MLNVMKRPAKKKEPLGVTITSEGDQVRIVTDRPVSLMEFDATGAEQLALALLQCAKQAKGETNGVN